MAKTFSTVDGKLLTNNESTTPEWLNSIDFKEAIRPTMDIDFDQATINSRTTAARRDGMYAGTREVVATFNDKTLQSSAMAKLAKFVAGRRYVVADVRHAEAGVELDVNFEQNPLLYTFNFTEEDGHVVAGRFFKASNGELEDEFPFNSAGFEDSLEFANGISCRHAQFVKAPTGMTRMTRYDIIKRCCGRLREAQDAIEAQLKNESIVAIGSNEYASTYDMAYIFPDLNEVQAVEASHTFDYADNHVSTTINEHKTSERLSIESTKIIGRSFNLKRVVSADRDNSELLIKAEVVANNARTTLNFNFTVDNERVASLNYVEFGDGERRSVAQALAFLNDSSRVAELLNNGDERVVDGYVYSVKTVHSTLGNFVAYGDVLAVVDNWSERGLIDRLNTTTFASKLTLNELLRESDVKLLSEDDVQRIRVDKAHFGQGLRFERTGDQDCENRDLGKLNAANLENFERVAAAVGQCFDTTSVDVTRLTDNKYALSFTGDAKRQLTASIVNGNVVVDVHGKSVGLDVLRKMFSKSKLLSAYVNETKLSSCRAVFSKKSLTTLLDDVLDADAVDQFVNEHVASGALTKVASDRYVSEYGLLELINTSSLNPDVDRRDRNLTAGNKAAGREVSQSTIGDDSVRYVEATVNVNSAKAQLMRALPENVKCLSFDAVNVGDDSAEFAVRCFNTTAGVSRNVNVRMTRSGVELHNPSFIIAGKAVAIDRVFTASTAVTALNRTRGAVCSSVVITRGQLNSILAEIVDSATTNVIIDSWLKLGALEQLDSNTYASRYAVNDLLESANITPYDEETRAELTAAKARFGLNTYFDKVDVADGDTRSTEASAVVTAGLNAVSDYVNTYLQSFAVKHIAGDHYLIDFTSGDDRKRQLTAVANFDNGKLIDVNCVVNGSTVSLAKINERFRGSDVLQRFAKNVDQRVIISRKKILERLATMFSATDAEQIVNGLVEKGVISQIDSVTFATTGTVDDVFRAIDDAPNDEYLATLVAKRNRVGEHELSRNYEKDGEVRVINDELSDSEVCAKVAKLLPANIVCSNVDIVNRTATVANVTADCFNRSVGVSSKLVASVQLSGVDVSDLKVENADSLEALFACNNTAKAYSKLFGRSNVNAAAIVSIRELTAKLKVIAADVNVDDVLTRWERLGKVEVIDSTKFASRYTLTELLTMSNIKADTDEDVANRIARARKSADIIPRQVPVEDFGSADVRNIADGKTVDAFNDSKRALGQRVETAFKQRFITANKCGSLLALIDQAKTNMDIARLTNDVNRYV